jgi:hypothetical protein
MLTFYASKYFKERYFTIFPGKKRGFFWWKINGLLVRRALIGSPPGGSWGR